MKGSELRFRSFLNEYLEALAGAQKFQKTLPSNASQKAANDVIAILCFEQPETPFFPYGVNFSGSKDGSICFAVSLVFFCVVKRNARTRILGDECITDKSSNRHAVFTVVCSH